MKALLLGSSGWIGKHVISQRPDWQWTCVDSKTCDLEQAHQVDKIDGDFDVIIHTAGFFGGLPFNLKHGKDILFKNMRMNTNVCSLVARCKPKKFIIVSSACVYPPQGNKLLTENMIGPTDFHPSVKHSALAKLNLLQMAKNLDCDFEYLIVSNGYGPGEHTSAEKSHIIGSLIKKIMHSDSTLEMMGTGIGVRDYIYIDDIAEAICRYCELENTTNSCTNISTSHAITVKEIVQKLLDCSKKNLKLKWGDPKDDGVEHKILDNSKMQNDIDFNPSVDMDVGLRKTWIFFKDGRDV